VEEELPEDEAVRKATDWLSIGRMVMDEDVRESRADVKINGASVVPYVHWTMNDEKEFHTRVERNECVQQRPCGFGSTILRQHGPKGCDV